MSWKQCLTLMLEDKQAQDMDRRHQESEREQLQNEIARKKKKRKKDSGPDSSVTELGQRLMIR